MLHNSRPFNKMERLRRRLECSSCHLSPEIYMIALCASLGPEMEQLKHCPQVVTDGCLPSPCLMMTDGTILETCPAGATDSTQAGGAVAGGRGGRPAQWLFAWNREAEEKTRERREDKAAAMAAKSDGVLKIKKSDVAFTPLQNSDHSGSVQGLVPGLQPDSGTGEADFVNGESRCCGGSNSTCLRLGREQQKYTVWDCLWILAAVAVYFADVGTDVWLSVDYYLRRDYWWFGLTLFFVVLGSFSVQVFSFRWFVHDFSTEDSSGVGGSAASCSHMDGKLLSSSASHGDVGGHPSTPQRQASTTSKSNSSNAANAARTKTRSASCSLCIWLLQSILHILQLGQIWR
ncbi:hypothetical protein DNTS_026032 [Danionella cerebrum]|uniref:XK-related protein n=1 Tax=Danionella cerebrum TaxID=2873325 RepID=A0A553Q2H6_9TELE|nr:hypothetical protein DNTS_026032 [Danionella translucida]